MSRGDPVGVQLEKEWTPAVITDVASTPRSFIVQTPSGQLFRRNRKFLLRRDNESQSHLTPETVVSQSDQEPPEDVQDLQSGVQPEKAIVEDLSEQTSPKIVTRSGREINQPARYK